MDYRDFKKYPEKFDRVVSVGMVEHVGRENYPLFLECVQKPSFRENAAATGQKWRRCLTNDLYTCGNCIFLRAQQLFITGLS